MEVLAVVLSLAIIIVTLVFLSRRDGGAKLPPGSLGWPIMGETIEFLFGKPEKFVCDRMRKYSADIFKTKILGEKTVVICGPKGNKFIFSNENKYFASFRPHPMQHIFRSYKKKAEAEAESQGAEEVKVVRQPGFFKPEALMRYLSVMDSVTQKQLQAHCAGKDVVEIHPLSKTITLSLACHFFLGVDNPERIARLVEHFDRVSLGMHSVMVNLPGTTFYRANKAAAALRKELGAVIREKKRGMAESGAQTNDILSHLINMASGGEAEIADKIMGLLTAGYSTVATAMTFFVKYVGLSSQIYEKVRAGSLQLGLKQGDSSVTDYERKFNRLSRYAARLVNTEDQKADRFLRGLRPEIRGILAAQVIENYGLAVRSAQEVASGLEMDTSSSNARRNEKRKWEDKGGEERDVDDKHRRCEPSREREAPKDRPQCATCKKYHFGKCMYGTGNCYHCHQPGHNSTTCPNRKERKEPERRGNARVFQMTEVLDKKDS